MIHFGTKKSLATNFLVICFYNEFHLHSSPVKTPPDPYTSKARTPPKKKKRKNNHCFPLFLQSFIVSKVLCWKLAGISEKGLPLITAWSTSGNLAWQPQTTTFLTSLTLEQFPCSHVAGTTIQNETSQQTLEVVGM